MRNRMLLVAICLFLLSLTVPGLAQLSEDGKTYTFTNGLTLSIPDAWTAAEQDEDEGDFVAVDDGRTGLALYLYYEDTLAELKVKTSADLINAHYDSIYEAGADEDQIEDATLEGQDGAYYLGTVTTEDDEYEQAAYAFLLPDGTGLLGLIYPMNGSGLRKSSEEAAVPLIENVLEGVEDLPTNSDSNGGDIDIDLPDIGPAGGDDDEDTNTTPADDSASDDGVHNFGYRTTFTLPEGWEMEDDNGSSILINDGTTKIELAFYTPHRAGLKGRDADDLIVEYFKTVNNAENNVVDPDNIEETDIAGLEGARYETLYSPEEGEEYELSVVSLILPNEAGIIALLYPVNGDRLESEFRALSVIEDFVAAQPETPSEIDLGYNIVFDVPRGWAVYNLQDSFVDLDNGGTSLTLSTYYPAVVESQGLETPEDVLAYYMEDVYPDISFRERDAESVDLGPLEGARFMYDVEGGNTTDTFPRVVIATVLEDEQRVLVADIIPVQGDRLVGEEETISLFEEIASDMDEMPDEFVFIDESVFEIPRGWYYYLSTEDYYLVVEDDETGMYLVQYAPEEIEGITTAEEMLEWYHDENIGGSELEDVEVGGIEGVRYDTEFINDAGESFDRIEYAFITPNGYSQVVVIYALYGDPIRERDALALLEDYLEQYD